MSEWIPVKDRYPKRQRQSNKLPSKLSMIRSAVEQLYSSIRSVRQGLPVFVPPNIAQERFEICNDCEFFDKNSTRCGKCGCFMKKKVDLADAKCPIGTWGKYE